MRERDWNQPHLNACDTKQTCEECYLVQNCVVCIADFEKPLFRSSVKSIQELNPGDVVTGRVMNVTNFGAFVDIGVGTNALIHVSKMTLHSTHQKHDLQLGEKVEGRIENIETDLKRIGMRLLRVI